MNDNHYHRLLAMAGLSFAAMYVLMYAMVDSTANVFNNVNQVYMAGLMAAPMLVIELLLMGGMYHNKKLNALIAGSSVVVALTFFFLIRQQTGVGDRQFLRSMIPHHAAAVLMCEQASIDDPRIHTLCAGIVSSQTAEIKAMQAMLNER